MNQQQMIILAFAMGVTTIRDVYHMLDVAGFARFLSLPSKQ